MKDAFIIQKGQKRFFEIPPEWNLLTFATVSDKQQVRDVKELTKDALRNPIQASPLEESLSGSDTVVILVEDITRTSPKRILLECILEVLNQTGIPKGNISIIIALGSHRGLTSEELEGTFGRDLIGQYEFSNHDCNADDLVTIGRLDTGGNIKINRKFHEATFRIGIGSIVPHPMNGFGGGGKILFPGVAGFESILEHHLKYTFHEGTALGKIEGNLFYDNVCSIARSAGLNYIVNSILDQNDRVCDMVTGDPIGAHHVGIQKSRDVVSQKFDKRADLTIISSFPYTEGPQITKPLVPASMVTRKGGCIILVADCTGNLPEAFIDCFEGFHSRYSGNLLNGVLECFEGNRLIMENGAVDFNMALGITLAIQHRFRTILVTKDVPRKDVEKMGFIYAADLEDSFRLSSAFCPGPEVHVIPAGGVILPVF